MPSADARCVHTFPLRCRVTYPCEDRYLSQRISSTTVGRIDAACVAFEDAWARGDVPAIQDFLAGFEGVARDRLFGYLLDIDRDERARRGTTLSDDEYEARFPEFEALIRTNAGSSPTPIDPTDPDPAPATIRDAFDPILPSQVGPYRIVRLIGEGGMGRVFEAEQQSPKRRVALKLVGSRAHTPDLMRRFTLETEVLARLHHPGIAAIYECGEHDGGSGPQPYFAMEYVDGVDVRTHAERARLDVRARLAVMAEVADAIEHAHTKGVIHRDLKPDNVLVNESGRPKVLDFGIARITDDSTLMQTAVTETGQLIGTLNYMAPEQLRGDSSSISARTDVYALGVILFELLTGRRPHEVSGLLMTAAIRKVTEEEAPRLGRLVTGVERDVETIVGKALAKDPDRRYATAGALAGDLRRFLAHEPITARPPSAVYVARRFARRHRGLVGGSVLALLAIALGFLALFESNRRVTASHRQETRARQEAERMGIDALASSFLAIHATLSRGDRWAARDQLDRVAPEHRGWEWRWLDARAPLVLRGMQAAGNAVQGHYVSGIQEGLALIRPMVVADLRVPEQLRVVPGLDGTYAGGNAGGGPAVCRTRVPAPPGSEHTHHAASAIVDLPSASVIELIEHPSAAASNLEDQVAPRCLTPDGTLLETMWPGSEPGKWQARFRVTSAEDRATGRFGPWSPNYHHYLHPALSADGKRVMLTGRRVDWCRIVSTEDFRDLAVLEEEGEVTYALDRTGERLARQRDGSLEIVAIPSLEVLRRFQLPSGAPKVPTWIQNDAKIVVRVGHSCLIVDSDDGTVLETIDDSSPLRLSGCGKGRFLVFHGGRENLPWIYEVEAPPGAPYRELRGHTSWVYHVAYSPDGSLIASDAPKDAYLRIWDGWTGAALAQIERPRFNDSGQNGSNVPLAFSDDGRTLVTTIPVDGGQAVVAYDLCTGESKVFPKGLAPERYRDLRSVLGSLAGRCLNGTLVGHPNGSQVFQAARWAQYGMLKASIRDVDTGEITSLGPAQGIALSPDGQLLALGGIGEFRLVDTSDRETVATYKIGSSIARYYALAWSPDGERLALGEHFGHVTILETKHFRPIVDLPDHDDYVYSMVWSPDGTRLVTASGDGTLRIHDTLHGIPSRLRAEDRAERASEQLAKLDALVAELGSVEDAVDALLAAADADEATALAARRACLLRWTRHGIDDGR